MLANQHYEEKDYIRDYGEFIGASSMIVVAGKNNIAVHALNKLIDIVGANSLIALPNRNDDGNDSWQRSFRLAAEKKEVRIEFRDF